MGIRIWLALALVACGSTEPSWKVIAEHESSALLAVWGDSTNDVWVVGGRTTVTGGPTVLHYTKGAWTRVDTGQLDLDLWWVFGTGGDDVWFGGSGGTILRYRGGAFERMTTPRTGTIFGIWGANDQDVWAVGDGGAGGGIVWHYDGVQWTEVALPAGVPSRVFKVHGQASDDVWISCVDGSTLHWQGTALERQLTGVTAPLFSIVTTPERTYAVGGANTAGQIAEHTADGWTTASFEVPTAWRGAAARDADIYAVGEVGVVAKREDAGWSVVPQPLTQSNFHAAWVDPAAALWGVGGDFDRLPLTADGFLIYYGPDDIAQLPPGGTP
jgi:hypothetical protein